MILQCTRQKINNQPNDRKIIGKRFKINSVVVGMRWLKDGLQSGQEAFPAPERVVARTKSSRVRKIGQSSENNYLLSVYLSLCTFLNIFG